MMDEKDVSNVEEVAQELVDEPGAFVSEEIIELGVRKVEMGREEVGGV